MNSLSKWMSALALFGVVSAAPLTSDGVVATAEASPAAILSTNNNTIADITEKVMPSVVSISTTTQARLQRNFHKFGFGDPFSFGKPRSGRGVGSGVIVSKSGYVLTNNHVVANAETIKLVLHSGKKVTAKVIGTDPASDLAVLKIQGKVSGLQPLEFGDSSALRLGEVVLAMGNPLGVGKSVTMGIVSAKNRAAGQHDNFIQTDAAINPGNSGGALVNMKGELVGINTAIISRTGGSQGIGFAIPSDEARPIMHALINDGKVSRGWLGVGFQEVNSELASALDLKTKSGALITDVMPGSPAAKAGLQRDDVVTHIDGKRIRRARDFRKGIARAGAGKTVKMKIVRKESTKAMSVQLGDRDKGLKTASHSPAKAQPMEKLGVRVAPTTGRAAAAFNLPADLRGLVVTEVAPDSRAEEMGLAPGDVILGVNRRPVHSARDLSKAFRSSKRRIALRVWRDGMTSYMVTTK